MPISNSTWERTVLFNDEFFPNWRSHDPFALVAMSNALAGEVGEICNATKHVLGGGTHQVKVDIASLSEELVDVYIYLVLLAECLGMSESGFEEAFERKMKVNVDRMRSRK